MNELLVILERLKLSTKLNLGFGVVILFLLLAGMQGIYSQYRLNESTKKNGEQLLTISNIKQANINLIYIARAIRQMALVQHQEDRDKLKQNIFKFRGVIRQHVDLAKKTFSVRKDQKVSQHLMSTLRNITKTSTMSSP